MLSITSHRWRQCIRHFWFFIFLQRYHVQKAQLSRNRFYCTTRTSNMVWNDGKGKTLHTYLSTVARVWCQISKFLLRFATKTMGQCKTHDIPISYSLLHCNLSKTFESGSKLQLQSLQDTVLKLMTLAPNRISWLALFICLQIRTD